MESVTKTGRGLRSWEKEKEVSRLYDVECPRLGPELDEFVQRQREYFGLTDKQVRYIVGKAQLAQESQFRGSLQTRAQRIGERMGVTEAELFNTIRGALRATKRKHVVGRDGVVAKDEEGKPVVLETPDWINRLRAVDIAAKLTGSYAPRQVQIEAHHEHTHSISDDELRREFAALAGGLGFTVVEAKCSVIEGTEANRGEIAAGVEAAEGGDMRLLLADDDDGNG